MKWTLEVEFNEGEEVVEIKVPLEKQGNKRDPQYKTIEINEGLITETRVLYSYKRLKERYDISII